MPRFNYPIETRKSVSWLFHQQSLILCQFFPNNPFWVVRPRFVGSAPRPREPGSPSKLLQAIPSQQALSSMVKWLQLTQHREDRCRLAWCQRINHRNTDAQLAFNSKALNHISNLYQSLNWPESVGLIYPESIPIIGFQVKKIWVVEPLEQFPISEGLWKRYDYDGHIEYARLR